MSSFKCGGKERGQVGSVSILGGKGLDERRRRMFTCLVWEVVAIRRGNEMIFKGRYRWLS